MKTQIIDPSSFVEKINQIESTLNEIKLFLLNKDFQDMWLNSDIFKKFREMKKKLKGKCKDCRIKEYCGGCRSISLAHSKDFYGEDEACIKNAGG